MKFSSSLSVVALAALLSETLGAPTWPASTDDLEELMFQTTGFRTRNFADFVTPCSKSPNMPGRMNAAEWMRTAFHDMATHDIYQGRIGGLDASLMFELARSQNNSPAFASTFIQLQQFMSSKTPMADLLALAMYASVRSCGGPVVPVKGGRVDAEVAGLSGVPQPEDPQGTFIAQFARMGFSVAEMVEATACGHTLGGVHSAQHPLIVPVGTAPNEYALMDDPSQAASKFDAGIARDYVLGNTTNPLVVGSSVRYSRHADFKVFTADRNVTIRTLTNEASFRARCSVSMAKIIDTVPAGVTLSPVLVPYDVKPVRPQLHLLDGGRQLRFTGEIRIRTSGRDSEKQVASVNLRWQSRDESDSGESASTGVAGTGGGFDDSFVFYSFDFNIPTDIGISKYSIDVRTADGMVEEYNNNGVEFPMQDSIIYLPPQSCLPADTDEANNRQMTVVAAKLTSLAGEPVLDLAQQIARTDGVVVPRIVKQSLPMIAGATVGPYTLYSVTTPVGSTLSLRNNFDVVLGLVKDEFKFAFAMGQTCAPLAGDDGSSSTTSSSTTTSSTSTTQPPDTTTTPPTSTTEPPSSTTTPPPSSTSEPPSNETGWVSVGCYTDSVAGRTLSNGVGVPDLTNAKCQAACKAGGFKYAGTEYAQECFCGNTLGGTGAPATSGCSMACQGDSSEICGGPDRLTIWEYKGGDEPEPSPTSTPPAGPTSTPFPGWTKEGCYTDSAAARALSYRANIGSEMSNGACTAACDAAGYVYAGTEFGAECFCGNEIENEHTTASSGCSMPCNAASGEVCGGPDRLTLWKRG